MSMTSPSTPPPSDDNSIAALKRLKQVEAGADEELTKVKTEGEHLLADQRAAADAAVAKARHESEQLRMATVEAARRETEAQVALILAEGVAKASAVPRHTPEDVEALREKLLDALFGEFRPGSKSEG
jgi:vacuolar-type H+-ATPase subunit H